MFLKKDAVYKIADAAKEMQCYLIVDEAYIDFCADGSVIKDVERNPNLIVLRSLSGFYALAGLRIGYGIFPNHIVPRLKGQREPWTVNSLSQRAAVVALKDKVFRKESLKIISQEKKFLEKSFQKIGIEFFKSDAHFYLVKMDNAHEICRRLRTKGIIVRNCDNVRGLDSTYIMIAVKSHKENTILIKELAAMLSHNRSSYAAG
jgi:threonine-phosphate decarboxylase